MSCIHRISLALLRIRPRRQQLIRSAKLLGAYRCPKKGIPEPSIANSTTFSERCLSTEAAAVRENQEQREELSAAYQCLQHLGLCEGINNHLSTRAPARSGQGEVVLLFPYGLHWSEVTASRLVGVNLDGNSIVEGSDAPETTAVKIHCQMHQEILRNGSAINTVFHLHSPYSSALACLKDPTLRMIHQNSTRFLDSVAYDDAYEGLANCDEEGARLARVMANKSVLLMGNHGILVTGQNVAQAFNTTYYFERAAMVQILAMSTGHELSELDEATVNHTHKQMMENYDEDSNLFFNAMKRVIISPS